MSTILTLCEEKVMSDFKWLEDVVKARTQGKWKASAQVTDETDEWDYGEVYGPTTADGRLVLGSYADARFIATMGTLADTIMDVIKASWELRLKSKSFADGDGYSAERYQEMTLALRVLINKVETLKAAKEE